MPTDGPEILCVLGDTHDPAWPIYRGGNITLITALYDMGRSEVTLYRQGTNPCKQDKLATYPFAA